MAGPSQALLHRIGGDGRKIIVRQPSTLAAQSRTSGDAELVGHDAGTATLEPASADRRILETLHRRGSRHDRGGAGVHRRSR